MKQADKQLTNLFADLIPVLLACIGFATLYLGTFIGVILILSALAHLNFIDLFKFVVLTVFSFYTGKGINKFLKETK